MVPALITMRGIAATRGNMALTFWGKSKISSSKPIIAIIDNVPESKVDDTVKIFKDKFYSKKVFKEFALLIYRYYDKENRIKPILTNIFSLENPEIITIDAKFEYVGSCDEGDAADFVIVSY